MPCVLILSAKPAVVNITRNSAVSECLRCDPCTLEILLSLGYVTIAKATVMVDWQCKIMNSIIRCYQPFVTVILD